MSTYKGQIGEEDLEIGSGTFERTTSGGGTVTLTKIGSSVCTVASIRTRVITDQLIVYCQDDGSTVLHGMGDV